MPPLYATRSDKYHNSTVKVLPVSMNCVTSDKESESFLEEGMY